MTIRQQGGVFGRNPTFQSVETDGPITSNGDLTVSTGYTNIGGNALGATQITIADDAVGQFVPPRLGGFMFITTGGAGSFPSDQRSGVFFYDCGGSLRAGLLDWTGTISDSLAAVVTDVTGTTGVDGNVTLSVQPNLIKIENRSGGSNTFQLTFL